MKSLLSLAAFSAAAFSVFVAPVKEAEVEWVASEEKSADFYAFGAEHGVLFYEGECEIVHGGAHRKLKRAVILPANGEAGKVIEVNEKCWRS